MPSGVRVRVSPGRLLKKLTLSRCRTSAEGSYKVNGNQSNPIERVEVVEEKGIRVAP